MKERLFFSSDWRLIIPSLFVSSMFVLVNLKRFSKHRPNMNTWKMLFQLVLSSMIVYDYVVYLGIFYVVGQLVEQQVIHSQGIIMIVCLFIRLVILCLFLMFYQKITGLIKEVSSFVYIEFITVDSLCYLLADSWSTYLFLVIVLGATIYYFFRDDVLFMGEYGYATEVRLSKVKVYTLLLTWFTIVAMVESRYLFKNWNDPIYQHFEIGLQMIAVIFYTVHLILMKLNLQTIRVFEERKVFKDHDYVTELPSYRLFLESSEIYVENVRDTLGYIVYYYLDVDHFSAFDDSYGIDSGDCFLKNFGKMAQRIIHNGIVCRIHDDHFVAISSTTQPEEELQRLVNYVESYDRKHILSLSAGYYRQDSFEDGPIGRKEITIGIDNARYAMMMIKGDVEKNINEYDEECDASIRMKTYLVQHLDEAIENGDIKVYYQPVVNAKDQKICEVEALTRWIDPVYGFISPGTFIPVLEEAHLIYKVDMYVVHHICETYVEHCKKGMPFIPVSFNLSRIDFELCDVFKHVAKEMEEAQIPENLLHAEITESMRTVREDVMRDVIDRFKEMGVQVWMDDFGSGYSSLSTLKNYNFAVIKLDMVFLRDFNYRRKTMIESVVKMAKAMDMKTVAEGVETMEHYEFLKDIGCDMCQGYLFSKPIPYDELVDVIRRKELVLDESVCEGGVMQDDE